ncbi:MAG: T9SS type A sorting domain-containing protein, partial [candidate division WOR-3 bacterium]|nr:T9SS type A sorting domain-containing protein [candidate division WOR-3 bacterium]
RDSVSYWYWTEPSNYGWHPWYPYDFMMRVRTDYIPGISENKNHPEEKFTLYHPFPNPFSACVKISFNLPKEREIRLNIYDVSGRLVKRLINGKLQKGKHLVLWDGKNEENKTSSTGIYFIKVDFGEESFTEKLIFVR